MLWTAAHTKVSDTLKAPILTMAHCLLLTELLKEYFKVVQPKLNLLNPRIQKWVAYLELGAQYFFIDKNLLYSHFWICHCSIVQWCQEYKKSESIFTVLIQLYHSDSHWDNIFPILMEY